MNRQTDRRATQHNLERDRAIWTEKKLKTGVVAQRLNAIGKIPRYSRMKDCTDTIIKVKLPVSLIFQSLQYFPHERRPKAAEREVSRSDLCYTPEGQEGRLAGESR